VLCLVLRRLTKFSIELSPFTFPRSPSRIFTGSKHTSLISIDLRTGQQLDCFSSSPFTSNLSSAANPQDCTCDTTDDLLDDLEGRSRSARDTLFIGRTDYRLSIHTPSVLSADPTGVSRRSGVQEIAYSTYTPNSFDKPLAEFWAKTGAGQATWGSDRSLGKKMRVELRYDGAAVGVKEGLVGWTVRLGSIGYVQVTIVCHVKADKATELQYMISCYHSHRRLPTRFSFRSQYQTYQPYFLFRRIRAGLILTSYRNLRPHTL
jgi:hypothetical protein